MPDAEAAPAPSSPSPDAHPCGPPAGEADGPAMREWVGVSTDRDWGLDHETIQRAVREVREADG